MAMGKQKRRIARAQRQAEAERMKALREQRKERAELVAEQARQQDRLRKKRLGIRALLSAGFTGHPRMIR